MNNKVLIYKKIYGTNEYRFFFLITTKKIYKRTIKIISTNNNLRNESLNITYSLLNKKYNSNLYENSKRSKNNKLYDKSIFFDFKINISRPIFKILKEIFIEINK